MNVLEKIYIMGHKVVLIHSTSQAQCSVPLYLLDFDLELHTWAEWLYIEVGVDLMLSWWDSGRCGGATVVTIILMLVI